MSTYEHLLVEVRGQVATFTLNRPDARNALNSALTRNLFDAFAWADGTPDIRAVVLAGAGPAFCAGADLKELATSSSEARQRADLGIRLHQLLSQLRLPTVAAVHGPAMAGGCGLAAAMDFVIATPEAKFGFPEVSRGMVPALVMVNLSRLLGKRKALEMLLGARIIDAAEAESIGLITRTAKAEDIHDKAQSLAARLASYPQEAMRNTKQLFRRVQDIDFDAGLQWAGDVNLLARLSKDAQEGARKFIDNVAR